MYISVEQSMQLDKTVKSNEVALRSFISDVLVQAFADKQAFKASLQSISTSNGLIYSRRFSGKLRKYIVESDKIYSVLVKCKSALDTQNYNNNVPYVSEIIDLLLIYFDSHFSSSNISNNFSSIEEFHYCCSLYHKVRNNLSHPASRPITVLDANKVIYFTENILKTLDEKYFWYNAIEKIRNDIKHYKKIHSHDELKYQNLSSAASTHKSLLCRDSIVQRLYDCLLGDDVRQRLAGSVVLYGYGGVGKTAITTEFLYRLVRDKMDGKYNKLNYILFFSSKDEYLRENQTTGELYIDSSKPEFSNLEELQELICSSLKINSITEIDKIPGNGIIAIDNIENIDPVEKKKIIDFIKYFPRSVHFLVTSRNEEACEEKIHIEEFKNNQTGLDFVKNLIESEDFNVDINNEKAKLILDASKGNALVIVQILNILDRGVATFDEITKSLDSMKSKNSEMIANFMYKNTFDNALKHLSDNNYPVYYILQIITLYDEKIELYSISKLAKIDISDAERICNFLLERLILTKSGEYYELNVFAKRFVFIKLLPDRFELNNIKDRIKTHKKRMKEKLDELDSTLKANTVLHNIVNEWQPRNYIDKIVIAELFSLYGDAIKCVKRNDQVSYEKYLKEFNDHSFITNHPYVPVQKARLLREGAKKFYKGDKKIYAEIERAYEVAIESIEYDYRYLVASPAHASLLMLFGIFLNEPLKSYSRAIRFLEDAKKYYGRENSKGLFITCNYLSYAYARKYEETNDQAYKDQLRKVVKEVILRDEKNPNPLISISRYKRNYLKYLN